FYADIAELRILEAGNGEREFADIVLLVQNAHGVAVPDSSAADLDIEGIAVGDHIHIQHRLARKPEQHDRGHQREGAGVQNGPGPHDARRHKVAMRVGFQIAERVIRDELPRPADLVHDFVAGVDAKRALDAFELRSIAYIDAHRTSRDALPA